MDPAGISLIDSVQVYGKSKDSFGWPDDQDDYQVAGAGGAQGHDGSDGDGDGSGGQDMAPMSPLEKLVSQSLGILKAYFHMKVICSQLASSGELATPFGAQSSTEALATLTGLDDLRLGAKDLMSRFLTLSTSKQVEFLSRSVLAALFTSKADYCNHVDGVLLRHVASDLGRASGSVEQFHRLLLTARAVATTRPYNLVRFSDREGFEGDPESKEDKKALFELEEAGGSLNDRQRFMLQLTKWFWNLLECRPDNSVLGTLGQPGITHVEASVQAVIEVLHAFTVADHDTVPFVVRLYAQFLMDGDTQVSFAAKQALIRAVRPRVRKRKVFIPSPPYSKSPPPSSSREQQQQDAAAEQQENEGQDDLHFHDAVPMQQGERKRKAFSMYPSIFPFTLELRYKFTILAMQYRSRCGRRS